MDYYLIGAIWAVIDLILLLFFLRAAWHLDKYQASDEQIRASGARVSGNKLQQDVTINQVVMSLSGLEQLVRQLRDVTQKHDHILVGAKSKGELGEQLIELRLADLPQEWYARNVSFPNGTTVEFALRAPNRRWIPIDSQWTATRLLFQLVRATDWSYRNAFRKQVHAEVKKRAKEARKYIDKDCTLGFCIVAVPDPIFELSVDLQAELTSSDIVLISYSLLIPYLLLIVNQFLKTAESADPLRFAHIVSRSVSQLEVIQKYITREVIPPLETVGLQQTQHGRRNRGLDHVNRSVDELKSDIDELKGNLNEIQSELNVLRNMVNPIPNKDIDSIPRTLLRYLNLVRDSLLDGIENRSNMN